MATGFLASALALVTCALPWAAHPDHSITVQLDPPAPSSVVDKMSIKLSLPRPRPVYKWQLPPLTHDQWIVAASAWGECRSHGQRCMAATINVMANRAHRYGTTTAIESLKRAQLSCWGDQNRIAMWGIGRWINPRSPDGIAWIIARGLAIRETHGWLPDVTHGALFYATAASHPSWARGQRVIARIGGQLYYRQAARA